MSTALDDARALFAQSGLPFPDIPVELSAKIRQVAPWCFSSRRRAPPPYDMARYVDAARARRAADYVVLAHDGHGVNSYAIHYFLVRQPLCLFVQVAWGGVYTDAAQATARLEDCFNQATRLVQAVAGARTEGQMARDDRLIVVATDFYESSVEYRCSRRSSQLESYPSPGAALEAALRILSVGGGPPWRTH